ncbi:hypothetical protein K466DRAFT_575948 [Polyporus arcularius HHB13444]|uniref:Uncharacterized protein n=1 Tax=Polyporus arcularius HHB13444 TaxID=1314778 RepID=A0A5C3PG49_9APHY|nr:hypothetical protein K466DRAFT_575948 [Polyporus arcularius HHB13444]
MANSQALDQCDVKIEAALHDEHPRALKHVYVDAIHPLLGRIGSLQAIQINRNRCNGEFLMIMDEESQELCDFALALFDENGRLRPELVDHESQKGTGVWGRELDSGMLLYVLSVRVDIEGYRRNGVGTFLLQQLARSQFAPAGSYLIAWPSPEFQNDPRSEDDWQRDKRIAVDFFRKNHFRRVGRTQFLAYAVDASHPSRSLPIASDVAEQRQSFDEQHPPAGGPASTLGAASLEDPLCPLRVVIASQRLGIPTPDVVKRIQDAFKQKPSLVREKEEHGFAPLHVAAMCQNSLAVKALLELPPQSGVLEDLNDRDNREGLTPLELCEREMRTTKEFSQTLLGTWSGYSCTALRTVHALRRASGENIDVSEDEYVEMSRWGCTCGRCTSGWLSPRMRYRLLCTAQVCADNMMVMGLMRDGPGYEHLPEDIQETGVSKTFYRGYEAVVRAIADVLQKPGTAGVPLAENIRAIPRREMHGFLDRPGGTVECALDYVVLSARDQSPLGDSTFDDLEEETAEEGDETSLAYREMPTCVNDLDFSRVAERLGLPAQERYRSYGTQLLETDDSDEDMDGEEEEMEEEEDEEDSDMDV